MSQLRHGEEIVTVARGTCNVCKQPILSGKAVQLSKYTTRLRHMECMPKSDSRGGGILGNKKTGKALSE
jgi:hypothetical protein